MQKRRDFEEKVRLLKTRGRGKSPKMQISREKRGSLWFSTSETMRILAQTEPKDVQNGSNNSEMSSNHPQNNHSGPIREVT